MSERPPMTPARARAAAERALTSVSGNRLFVSREVLEALVSLAPAGAEEPDPHETTLGQRPAGRVIQPPAGRSSRAVWAELFDDVDRLAQAAWETAPTWAKEHGPWETTSRIDLVGDVRAAARRALVWLRDHPR